MRALLLWCTILAGILGSPAAWAAASYPVLDPVRGVTTLAPLLEQTTPAVVNISVASRVPVAQNPLMRDPFFRRFFEDPEQETSRQVLAAGSGVIVDARQGLVVTNNHVVEHADRITVTLKDQREFEARLVGTDAGTDIALLSIKPDRLAQVPFGDSDQLKVGDLVLAIGNPFGLGQTVTSGIISALQRSGVTEDGYEDFIQTDAPINPGNSGGALINTKGELIGINTAIIAPGGGNVGIGFSVPANMVKTVMAQLRRSGQVQRGRIGVVIQDVTPALAERSRLQDRDGALVAQIEPGSAAERAGLHPGDIVTAVDGTPVRSSAQLRNRIGLSEIDRVLELSYLRGGERRTASVRIAAPPAKASRAAIPELGGATLTDIPQDHPIFGQIDGVLVTGVTRGSPAAASGLRTGDIILAVDQQRVHSLTELSAVPPRQRRALSLNLLRDGDELSLLVR